MNALAAAVRPLYAPKRRVARRQSDRGVSGWWILPGVALGLGFWVGIVWLILTVLFGYDVRSPNGEPSPCPAITIPRGLSGLH